MAQTARQTHIIAQRRHPVAYWVLGSLVVASLGLIAIDERLGFIGMMLAMATGGILRRWATDAQ